MKNESYNYFPVNLIQSEHLIEFTGLKDFNRFLLTQRISTIFVLNNEQGEAAHFAVSYKGGLLRQATLGFKTMEDYMEAVRDQFPDSESFYTARQMGYKTYSDYKLVSEAGITNNDEYKAMKEKGFIQGYDEYKQATAAENAAFANPFELYKHAIEQQFENFAEYKTATAKGFDNGGIYRTATAKGFDTAADFKAASDCGFDSALDLKTARKLQIRDRADFHRYNDLEFLKNTQATHDQRLLLTLLSKLPEGKKVSINKLEELLAKALPEYRYADTNEMPKWFTIAFNGKQSIVDFLISNNAVKKYGHFDADGEFFETKTIQNRKVVIDGSNVAHNSQGNEKSKARVANIIALTKELQKRGFTDISVIADAALRHRLEDKDKLGELKKLVDYLEAPAETQADMFILQYVKMQHCLLVSNDLFRDWKNIDPWVAHNIDYYRIAFLIKEDAVLLPDLDKKD
ncbi:MAG: hypothetical protein POELPBGB_03733 [Bacteroidia bacterium]|nr:hypothetical protein [Bacteroidia bacterium]